jgi:hypothetical protein
MTEVEVLVWCVRAWELMSRTQAQCHITSFFSTTIAAALPLTRSLSSLPPLPSPLPSLAPSLPSPSNSFPLLYPRSSQT